MITVRLLLEALQYSGIDNIVVCGYGMKSKDLAFQKVKKVTLPRHPHVSYKWDFGITMNTECPRIPLFAFDKQFGQTYPMMLEESMGSIELSYGKKKTSRAARIIIYQHALHAIEALSQIEIVMPRTVAGLRKKISSMKSLRKEMKKLNEENLEGYRIEARVMGVQDVTEALRQTLKKTLKDTGLRQG